MPSLSNKQVDELLELVCGMSSPTDDLICIRDIRHQYPAGTNGVELMLELQKAEHHPVPGYVVESYRDLEEGLWWFKVKKVPVPPPPVYPSRFDREDVI